MFEVGSAVWKLLLENEEFQKAVKESSASLKKEMSSGFDQAASMSKKFVASLAGVTTGLVALFTAKVLKPGLTRLLNIEDAEKKLQGLGHTTQTVKEIMNSALTAVEGTFYALDEAATTAATAVAANIRPGKELTRYLTLVADAAGIAQVSMGDMGSVFNKVAATGKVYNDVLLQLSDQGIPIYQYLSKEMGKSVTQVKKLASEGKIDLETFLSAVEKNIGGSAKIMGDTTRGDLANLNTALARLGATVLKDVAPMIRKGIQLIKTYFADLNKDINDAGGTQIWFKGKVQENDEAIIGLASTILGLAVPAFGSWGKEILNFVKTRAVAIGWMTAIALAVAAVALGVNEVIKRMGGWAKVWEKVKPYWESLKNLAGEIKQDIGELAVRLKDKLNPYLDRLVEIIKSDVIPNLRDLKNLMKEHIPSYQEFKDKVKELIPTLKDLKDRIKEHIPSYEEFKAKVKEIVEKFLELRRHVLDAVAPALDFLKWTIQDNLIPALGNLWTALQGVIDQYKKFYTEHKTLIDGGLKVLAIIILAIVVAAFIVFILVMGSVVLAITLLINFIALVITFFTWLAGVVVDVCDRIGQVFKTMWNIVSGIYKAWMEAVRGFWKEVGNSFERVKGFVQGIIDWFKRLPGTIKDALKDISKIITQPFTQGFDILNGKVNEVKKNFRKLFNFNAKGSPSINDYIRWGTEGALKSYGKMFDSMSNMAYSGHDTYMSAVQTGLGGFSTAAPSGNNTNITVEEVSVRTEYPTTPAQQKAIATNVGEELNKILRTLGEPEIGNGNLKGADNG